LEYRHEQAYVLANGRPSLPAEPLTDVQAWIYSGNRCPPTEKAVGILKPLIETFTQPGQIVLDPFAGSGSTLVAAALAGREYLGIELEASGQRLAAPERSGMIRPSHSLTIPGC
jgi:site-specific DNA-methyltransferase (adenine-specific)